MASRKFNPKMPAESQWAHDRFYSTVGFCIESAIECGMMHLWATNRAPFYSEFWAHPAWSVGWMLFIPYWHDFHFWFIHRMIHVEPLSAPLNACLRFPLEKRFCTATSEMIVVVERRYKWVHSLHHKSYNPGPWSGFSMHPVESTIYLSSCLTYPPTPSPSSDADIFSMLTFCR